MDENQTADLDSTINEEHNEPVKRQPSNSNVAKLLEQRNEARRKAQELEQQLEARQTETQRLKELEDLVAKQALEKDYEKERAEFLARNPQAKEFENGINDLKNKYNLNYDDAYRLHLAQTKPELLVDEQYRNKTTSNMWFSWVGKEPDKPKEPTEMSADEFLKRSDSLAKKERITGWSLR